MTASISFLNETANSTLSKLLIDSVPICFILEDGFRAVKEYGKTRIPKGNYKIVPIYEGRFFERYKSKFGHKFALGIVADGWDCGFELLRIHGGNTVSDSLGCPMSGLSFVKPSLKTDNCFQISAGASLDAYNLHVYKNIAPDIEKNGFVSLIVDRYGSTNEGLIKF